MAKIIRHTYPKEFSIGLLLLIFVLASFISFEIFQVSWQDIKQGERIVFGMMLSGLAVVIMALILWEEFLFPVRIKPADDKIVFRNHTTKLKSQVLIFLLIPTLVVFLYLSYPIHPIAYAVWAAVVVIAPLSKLLSGIKNYNDYLQLTNDAIEYKNNEEGGAYKVSELQTITLVKDNFKVVHKVKLLLNNSTEITIDLDEMELDAYYETIEVFIKGHYGTIVKEA